LVTNSSTLTIHGTATGGTGTIQTNISHTAVTNLTDRLAQFTATNAVDSALITGDLAIEDAYFTNAYFLKTNGLAYFDGAGQLQLSNTISAALVPAALTNNDTRNVVLLGDLSSGAGKEQKLTINESVGFTLTNVANTSSFSVDPEGIVTTSGSYIGNGIGLTNIQGSGLSFGTIETTGATNFLITLGTMYQKIVATNDVAFTNHSGLGAASIRLLPNGANRHVYFPTNWCWLSTNNLTLSGSQWRSTITNGVSRVGWLSLVADGADATNVVATFTQTPR
jgi:hypothetical protein